MPPTFGWDLGAFQNWTETERWITDIVGIEGAAYGVNVTTIGTTYEDRNLYAIEIPAKNTAKPRGFVKAFMLGAISKSEDDLLGSRRKPRRSARESEAFSPAFSPNMQSNISLILSVS